MEIKKVGRGDRCEACVTHVPPGHKEYVKIPQRQHAVLFEI